MELKLLLTGMYMYYNTAAALLLVAVVASLAAIYWRKRIREQKMAAEEHLSAELSKANVASEMIVATAKNNQDMVKSVLGEVQSLHEGLDSLLILFTIPDLTPGKEEWNMAVSMIKEKSQLLADILDVTLELMFYDNLKALERLDHVSVNQFCQDVLQNCMGYLSEGVDIQVETSLEDDYMVYTDKETLRRIIRNLILNSMGNTRQGSITLSVGEDQAKGLLLFAVSDTAPAIPEELRDRIFKWMPRGNTHQLLLTLRVRACKLMARLLGGTLYVDSTPKGVSVVFSIKTT